MDMNTQLQQTDCLTKVLVVDDDDAFRTFLGEVLISNGYNVDLARSSIEASRLLAQKTFDLILLDWNLTGCQQGDPTGKGVLTEARSYDPKVLIVVMSGLLTGNVASDALLSGADSFFQKTSGNEILLSHISRLIGRRQNNEVLTPRDEKDILPLQELDRRYVRKVVKLLNNNISHAARVLAIHRHTVASMVANENPSAEKL
jgi:ActR/RegA family two-component response regulator